MTIQDIPAFNASLNAVATVLIVAGYGLIRAKRVAAHRACMTTAIGVSAVFLVGYVTHKILVRGVHTPFGGEGAIRTVYVVMLVSHIILAMAIVPLVLRTFFLARRGDFVRHRKWARVTFPIWLYVSVTGVLVYLFLYVWFPANAAAA
jgi:putative membrane protein